ncbi:MAG TPA: hypothetical protein VLU95_05165 [Candidatus Acidoferrum sp.]|nr:hypothetical protein [Candidatus Acidoferrum sp.]
MKKKTNQEINYAEAILAMRTMLSLNNAHARKLEISDFVSSSEELITV